MSQNLDRSSGTSGHHLPRDTLFFFPLSKLRIWNTVPWNMAMWGARLTTLLPKGTVWFDFDGFCGASIEYTSYSSEDTLREHIWKLWTPTDIVRITINLTDQGRKQKDVKQI